MPTARRSRSLPPADLSNLVPGPPKRSRVLTAELRCYLCGETSGTLEGPAGPGLPLVARFSPADGSPPRALAWQGLRCSRCGSASLVDELETVVRRIERVDWALEAPRRGRPPRWLVALRAPQDAA